MDDMSRQNKDLVDFNINYFKLYLIWRTENICMKISEHTQTCGAPSSTLTYEWTNSQRCENIQNDSYSNKWHEYVYENRMNH